MKARNLLLCLLVLTAFARPAKAAEKPEAEGSVSSNGAPCYMPYEHAVYFAAITSQLLERKKMALPLNGNPELVRIEFKTYKVENRGSWRIFELTFLETGEAGGKEKEIRAQVEASMRNNSCRPEAVIFRNPRIVD
jgi:hypothetical protein